jgi:Multicopper oxidase
MIPKLLGFNRLLQVLLTTLGISSKQANLACTQRADQFHSGHAFSVVKGASGVTNYVNPPQRDVSATGGSGLTIRFTADNPGCVLMPMRIVLFCLYAAVSLYPGLGFYIAISTFILRLALLSCLLKLPMMSSQEQIPSTLTTIGMNCAPFTMHCPQTSNNFRLILLHP